MELLTNLSSVRTSHGLDEKNIEHLKQFFQKTVGDKNEIHLEDFKRILNTKNPLFTERVFQIFDTDCSGSISLEEFICNVTVFANKSPDNKLKLLFQVYDQDGNGLIQFSELKEVIEACMEENGLKFSDEQIHDLTLVLFEDADMEKRGAITFEALKKQMGRYPGLLENLSISVEQWLVPQEKEDRRRSLKNILPTPLLHILSFKYMKNNYVYLLFLIAIIAVNVCLFITRAIQFRNSEPYPFMMLARAYGQCLNFNCMFVLVLMLRQSITFLRARGFSSFLPLDHHIHFHKFVGFLIFIYSIVHGVMHLINFCLFAENGYRVMNISNHIYNYTIEEWIFTNKPGVFGLIGGIANPTGVGLTIIIIIMYFCSQSFIRRGGCFEIFYWTHLLYIPFWILLIFHGPSFWKWFIVPGILYALEWLVGTIQSQSGHGKTYVQNGRFLKPNVTYLQIKRPHHFHFNPGDYVFLKIPTIAKYEWHPFTISSAPEQKEFITLHIRGEGEWTNRLLNYVKEKEKNIPSPKIGDTRKRDNVQDAALPTQENAKPLNSIDNDGKYKTYDRFAPIVIQINGVNVKDSFTDLKPAYFEKYSDSKSKDLYKFHLAMRAPFNKSISMPDICPYTKMSDKFVLCEKLDSVENKELQNNYVLKGEKFSNVPIEDELQIDDNSSPQDFLISENDKESSKQMKGENGTLQVFLKGPYGAPSSHIFRAEHAVLIATGIGVTPFASILQSIMHRYLEARHTCPKCKQSFSAEIPNTVMNLKKVDFFWINRDQQSFEWFVNLLSELEIQQAELGETMERFLDMHMYITSALNQNDMKAVGLQIALDLLHKKEKRDLITGLRTRTKNGRPNWDEVFEKLKQEKKGKVTVFYCGPPSVEKILRLKCDEADFTFRAEVF